MGHTNLVKQSTWACFAWIEVGCFAGACCPGGHRWTGVFHLASDWHFLHQM